MKNNFIQENQVIHFTSKLTPHTASSEIDGDEIIDTEV